jgi:hypothetical protein
MSLIYGIIQTAGLTLALWFVRLFHESVTFDDATAEQLWLWILKPVALAFLSIIYILAHLRLLKNTPLRQYLLFSYIASALFCLSYLPDMFASFTKAGESNAVLLSMAFYFLGIITYGTIRGGTVFISHRIINKRVKSQLFQAVAIYPAVLIVEFCFFHTWHPITYFPAMPLPLPAARFEKKPEKTDIKYLLVESYMSGEVRQEIKKGGTLSLNILGQKIASQLDQKLASASVQNSLHILLPETFISIEDPSDIHALAAPVAETLFRSGKVDNLIWIQGAFLGDSNVILGTELQRAQHSNSRASESFPVVTLLRKKEDQMPMFEVASKGISYSSNEQTVSKIDDVVPDDQAGLKDFAQKYQLLICYESLFPSRWKYEKPAIVFTNHHLFTEYNLMNWVYFGFLRQLSFFFNSETKVVSNFNPSGVLRSRIHKNSSTSENWSILNISITED